MFINFLVGIMSFFFLCFMYDCGGDGGSIGKMIT
jgi:hypothetical protein